MKNLYEELSALDEDYLKTIKGLCQASPEELKRALELLRVVTDLTEKAYNAALKREADKQ